MFSIQTITHQEVTSAQKAHFYTPHLRKAFINILAERKKIFFTNYKTINLAKLRFEEFLSMRFIPLIDRKLKKSFFKDFQLFKEREEVVFSLHRPPYY